MHLENRPLITFSRDYLKPWVSNIYISANQYPEVYKEYGTVVPDDPVYGVSQGPLAGIASVLAQIGTPWLCVLPVDSPVIPRNTVPGLIRAVEDGVNVIAYVVTDRVHPLCMLIHVSCLPSLRAYLLAGERKVQTWLCSQPSIGVHF